MALIDILAAVATHTRVGRHRGAAAGTLEGLSGRLVVLVEIRELNHEVRCDNGQGKVNLYFRLTRGQLNFLSFVPTSRPSKKREKKKLFC